MDSQYPRNKIKIEGLERGGVWGILSIVIKYRRMKMVSGCVKGKGVVWGILSIIIKYRRMKMVSECVKGKGGGYGVY